MAIDRIGKGGVPTTPEASGAPGVEKKDAIERPFRVDGPDATTKAEGASGVDPSSPLARLRAGEIDVHGYVDLKVDEATASLKGLAPADLDEIKKVLRAQMTTDPGLVDLVQQATGQTPKPPADE